MRPTDCNSSAILWCGRPRVLTAFCHGIVTVPELGKGFADSSNTKTVIVFDLKTLKPLATLAAGEDADAILYDSETKRVFCHGRRRRGLHRN